MQGILTVIQIVSRNYNSSEGLEIYFLLTKYFQIGSNCLPCSHSRSQEQRASIFSMLRQRSHPSQGGKTLQESWGRFILDERENGVLHFSSHPMAGQSWLYCYNECRKGSSERATISQPQFPLQKEKHEFLETANHP